MAGYVQVIGKIWMPMIEAAMQYTLDGYHLGNIYAHVREVEGVWLKDAVESWVMTNTGDFSSITDWYAYFDGCEIPWKDEDSEWRFHDLMYGEEE